MTRNAAPQPRKYIRRVSTLFVKPHMFITELDRPWIETPFWVQGFDLKTDEELDALQRYCSSVYIDIRRGLEAEYYMEDDLELSTSRYLENRIQKKYHLVRYRSRVSLRSELPRARTALEDATEQYRLMLQNLKLGSRFRINNVFELIAPLSDSIMRNADAVLLLSRLRSHHHLPHVHAVDACVIALVFGRFMGLRLRELRNLAAGALLMDIGKLNIPKSILYKMDSLTREEQAKTCTHVEHGVNIIKQDRETPEDIINMVLTHHERADGSGYPNGLKLPLIPAYGKIAAVIDSYNAMCTLRPYDFSKTPYTALKEIYSQREQLFQPEIVEKFVDCTGVYPGGSLVEFGTGEVGLVLAQNPESRLKPQVLLLLDAHKTPCTKLRIIDLQAQKPKRNTKPLTIVSDLQSDAYHINLQTIYNKLDSVMQNFHLNVPINNPPRGIFNRFMLKLTDLWDDHRPLRASHYTQH